MRRAYLSAPTGVIALVVIALILLVAIIAPVTYNHAATTFNLTDAVKNMSAAHWFGTDALGRDIFARVMVATRLSVIEALLAAAVAAFIGISLGVGAAVLPGRLRTIALRTIDACIALPGLLVAIFIVTIMGQGIVAAVIGTGISISFSFARVTSSLSLAIAGRDYIAAARISGIGRLRLMLRYVLPNIAETLAITTTVAISYSITTVATLSFLGLGVQSPAYDWGGMLTTGVESFYQTPAAALGPALALAITSLATGFFGEALARAMNPVLWAGQQGAIVKPDAAVLAGVVPARGDDTVAGPSNGEAVLLVKNLSVRFPSRRGDSRVVDGVSFWLKRGARLGIVGESGSGKTTTALAIANLVAYPGKVSGRIELAGRPISTDGHDDRDTDRLLGTEMAIVYQDALSSLNPALRIGTQLTESVQVHKGMRKRDARKLAAERLREVNIPQGAEQLGRHPNELSGGMRQRVMIAMGLMTEPALLICDEPTTSLDVTVQAQIMDLLARVNRDHGTTTIFISHNLTLVSQNTDRVMVMYAGRVVEDLSTEQLLKGGLHPYTRQLLAAIPDMSKPKNAQLANIPGHAPDPANLPTGCPYHPRCPLAFDKCSVDRPPLLMHEGERRVACWAVTEKEPVS